jgi:hypothetical protein
VLNLGQLKNYCTELKMKIANPGGDGEKLNLFFLLVYILG